MTGIIKVTSEALDIFLTQPVNMDMETKLQEFAKTKHDIFSAHVISQLVF